MLPILWKYTFGHATLVFPCLFRLKFRGPKLKNALKIKGSGPSQHILHPMPLVSPCSSWTQQLPYSAVSKDKHFVAIDIKE